MDIDFSIRAPPSCQPTISNWYPSSWGSVFGYLTSVFFLDPHTAHLLPTFILTEKQPSRTHFEKLMLYLRAQRELWSRTAEVIVCWHLSHIFKAWGLYWFCSRATFNVSHPSGPLLVRGALLILGCPPPEPPHPAGSTVVVCYSFIVHRF